MTKADAAIVREVAAQLADWMAVETTVIMTGRRPDMAGTTTARERTVAEALQKRDDFYKALRLLQRIDLPKESGA